MKAIQWIACLCVLLVLVCFASESFAQCGRQVVSQQTVQAAPQPAVSVFQLPAPQALAVQSRPAITSSQTASIGGASLNTLALPQAAAPCTGDSCQQTTLQAQQAVVQPAAIVVRPSFLQSLRASRPAFRAANRPQTIRQRTVIRG